MKKLIMILLLVSFAFGSVYAQIQMSAGGGAFLNADFGNSGFDITVPSYGTAYSEKFKHSGFGLFAFFDITYIEFSLGILWGSVDFSYLDALYYGVIGSATLDMSSIHIGVLGKYPIVINDGFAVFPAVGIDYQIISKLAYEGISMPNYKDLSSLWIRFGGGLNYHFNGPMYIRGTLLYGVKLPSKYENDMKNAVTSDLAIYGYNSTADNVIGNGVQLKFAVGYMF